MNSSRLLVAVVVLQALILLGQWTQQGPLAPAMAQIPDAGAQRGQMVQELRTLNEKMDKIVDLLQSGKVQVGIIKAEEAR